MLFQEGGAHKWKRSRSWYSGVSNWEPVKTICLKRWHGAYGQTRNDVWAGVPMEEIEGSCLQYVPMDEVLRLDLDPVALLALWCKYPAVEYVWKMGFAGWLVDRGAGAMGRNFRGWSTCARDGRTGFSHALPRQSSGCCAAGTGRCT